MAMRLLVEGLDWAVNDARLQEVFAPFGELVESRIAVDWETGRSRGFGWVTYEAASDAEAAMAALDGQKLSGKTLRVMIAPEQTPRPSFRSADYGYTNATTPASGFRNADFDGPVSRPLRTDRKLFRSADFGYVEPPAAPPEPAPEAAPKGGATDARPAPKPDEPAGQKARPQTAVRRTPPPVVLDDDEASNRAKYGGWEEREDNDGGRGGGGNPFG
jgi:RNA recognition motif-containing protein